MDTSAGTHPLIAELLGACSSLVPSWERERAERMDNDPENPLDYIQAAALAQVVVDAFLAGDRDRLPKLFDRLEHLLKTIPMKDRDLLIVGFLEDLQGVIGWSKL